MQVCIYDIVWFTKYLCKCAVPIATKLQTDFGPCSKIKAIKHLAKHLHLTPPTLEDYLSITPSIRHLHPRNQQPPTHLQIK